MSLDSIEIRKFCGIPVEEIAGVTYACDKEATGDLTVELEDGIVTVVPICAAHLDEIRNKWPVETITDQSFVVL